MKTVATYSRKGGTGKSTISFILACFASAAGHRVLLVAMDPQGDGPRWASGGDRKLMEGDYFESPLGFTVLFSPRYMPELDTTDWDLVVIDMPPEVETVSQVNPNLWLTPLDGRDAVLDTMPVIPQMIASGAQVLFVMNKVDTAGKRVMETLHEGMESISERHEQVFFWSDELPVAGSIARVPSYFQPPWKVPFGKGTKGANSSLDLCTSVMGMLELRS